MTEDPQQVVIISTVGAKPLKSGSTPTSPPRKVSSNPQQGMTDPAASVSVNTAATTANTACTSPLTVTSLDAAATTAAAFNDGNGVPQVVSRVVPAVQQPEQSANVPTVEEMLAAPMADMGLNHMSLPVPQSRLPMEDKKMHFRTPPTEHDNRKLFVGGLPTDVSDRDFLEFFQQFGDVIDSVVIIDRLTKRSRGFGFVTFADEGYANSLLTAIPGKTGYVMINGKQCEIKASTPKADDGSFKHGHHSMWKPNPPRRDSHDYAPHQPNNASHVVQMKQALFPRGTNYYNIDNGSTRDVDGHKYDEVYVQQSNQPISASHALMYHQHYQNAYANAGPNGYAYTNSPAASGATSYGSSYPAAPSQGYGQYASNAGPGNGYYDPYGQQYHTQYANQYGNNSTPLPYGYYAEQGSPSPGVSPNDDGSVGPYAYSGGENYDNGSTTDQYE